MNEGSLVAAEDFCSHHGIEISFLQSLNEYGMVHLVTVEEKGFIPEEELGEVESLLHLYYDLEINLEGIDAIKNLLQRLHRMDQELTALRNRLRLYENG
jgi:hypothetical protein